MSYYIVEFLKDKSTYVVPSWWTAKEGEKITCLWPSDASKLTICKLIKKKAPTQSTWEQLDIRILHTKNTFEDALKKLDTAEQTSDLETEDSEMEKRSRRKRKRIVLSDDSGSEEVNDFDLWPMPSPPPYACPPERHSQPTMSTHSGTPMPSRESGMSLRNSPERHSQPTMSTHSGAPIPSRGSGLSFRNSPERHSEPTMLTHSGAPIPSKGSGVSFRYSPGMATFENVDLGSYSFVLCRVILQHLKQNMVLIQYCYAVLKKCTLIKQSCSLARTVFAERHYQPTMSTHSSALGLSRERGVLLHESSERHSQPTMSTHSSAPALSREHGVSLHASSERRYQPTMSAHSSAPALSREHGVLFHESSERDSQPTMSTYSSAPVLSRKHGDDYNACSIRNLLLKLQARQLAFEEKVLHNHAQILSEVKQFRRMLVAHGKTSKPVRLPEDCPKIPATNISELLDIERYLEKESNMEALVHFFSKKGGNDHNDCVRAVLGDLVANEAALQLSWKGSGGTKGSFQKFEQILSLILSSVKDHDCVGTATLTSVKKVVKPWLAGAGDRRGGRNRRRKASCAPE
ncbi:uncharacterized protein LOC120851152 [Ixodes scapularis]|uniref:uncharacterized protein LOC120851152 n=1 Tax=Ixodes scapularis TaxID=6945 RepID=UPI001C38ACE5|nr:uncharacterized protein LOC120851152 [Ixodes scapularis]